MNRRSQPGLAELRGSILRDVSRSFFLSIRLLPRELRDPVALAYLLARSTDTIADTTRVAVEERVRLLSALAEAIQRGDEGVTDEIRVTFAAQQTNTAERRLLENLSACFEWLAALASDDRNDIREVLAKIARGQLLDLQRFGAGDGLAALQSAAELDEYTYLVAGCVGEFWTKLCQRKLQNFTAASDTEMLERAINYGKALQLTNILRDAGADLRAGRCYLPADELAVVGLQPRDLLDAPAAIEPVLANWRARADAGLRDGIEYSAAIRKVRLRIATALPALIGLRTMKLLHAAGARSLHEHIKVPRTEVRTLLFATVCSRASPRFLQAQL